MNEPQEIQVNSDFDCVIIVTQEQDDVVTIRDISTATSKIIRFQSPDSTIAIQELSAAFVTDGTDGKIHAVVSAALNNKIGTARVQAKIVMGGNTYYSSRGSIEILPNLS